jgi:hypothetical protein
VDWAVQGRAGLNGALWAGEEGFAAPPWRESSVWGLLADMCMHKPLQLRNWTRLRSW